MFIKAFLPDSARQLGGRRLATHSTTATALSWAAKCEISGGDGDRAYSHGISQQSRDPLHCTRETLLQLPRESSK